MPEPKIYKATELAVKASPKVPPLIGTIGGAQTYADKVTGSYWWQEQCPPSWMNADYVGEDYQEILKAPTKVLFEEGERGLGAVLHQCCMALYRGRRVPKVTIGRQHVLRRVQAISDPWVILHELAHVMTVGIGHDETGHGKWFAYMYHALVRHWLGNTHADALKASMKWQGMRLNYKMLDIVGVEPYTEWMPAEEIDA